MIRIFALVFVGIVGACHATAVAFFAIFALQEHDEMSIARALALGLGAPFVLLTAPSLYLAFRTRHWVAATGLALAAGVATIVLWRTA